MVTATETKPGVVTVRITTAAYGDVGRHWQATLGKPNHGYGKIYIDRLGGKAAREARRRDSLWEMKGTFAGNPAANLDECPGAMFIWETSKAASVEGLCATDNQRLGRDMKNALLKFQPTKIGDLWQVAFRFE